MIATAPFDILAQTYDADFTASQIGQLQRNRVWCALDELLKKYDRTLNILEINCGTGHDAMQLATMGHTVTATDASAVMIGKAKEKAAALPAAAARFISCAFNELGSHFGDQKFDLIFSNFGGLNCIDKKDLSQLAHTCSSLLKKDGRLFLVLLGKYCVWEMIYFSLRLKFKTAFRRFKSSSLFTVNGNSMPVYYYSPGQLKKIFADGFIAEKKLPVGLFIPPSYLEKKSSTKRLNRLGNLENCFSPSLLAGLADHYCCILKSASSS